MKKIAVSFSGGKDSTLALYRLIQTKQWDIHCLITTITETYQRVSIHGFCEELLHSQSDSLGIPLKKVYIPINCTNEHYKFKMNKALKELVNEGVTHVMFGDIFLEDIKIYREELIRPHGLHAVFPLWGENTVQLLEEFIALSFEAVITCVDTEVLSEKYAGKTINTAFAKFLPKGVDPCGENGEFHSFVFNGPIFRKPINISLGETKLSSNRFLFRDIILI
ncbi:diphthine--ammonia ligase [Bacillus sp. HMF5848]|uniref:Dph6-related ATP pyrophosphatase n=1 Tax=Bacillus sp. HMF5848 TaxID=2495421 RepID=UPI000F770304|nr:diphthine--ammonia ligase [Bacillus sp. HMF5848]RSK27243.1 diphthine--ammonia ligase [Bacillus sp. HMF5848]